MRGVTGKPDRAGEAYHFLMALCHVADRVAR